MRRRRVTYGYWAAVAFAIAGVLWFLWDFFVWQEWSFIGTALLIVAGLWALGVLGVHAHVLFANDQAAPTPTPTRQCTVQQWQSHWDVNLKRYLASWVCVGWSKQ
jgi:hypothetical protein